MRKRYLIPSLAISFSLLFSAIANLAALHSIGHASNLSKKGNYKQAEQVLNDTGSIFLLPGVKHKLLSDTAANQRWQYYLGYQNQAQASIKTEHYQAALDLLKKIGKDYPAYGRVSGLISMAQQRIAAVQAAEVAAAQAAAARRAQPVAAPNLPGPSSLTCGQSTQIKGKRFVSTSDFATIMKDSSVPAVAKDLQDFFNQYGLSVEASNITTGPSFTTLTTATYDLIGEPDVCSFKSMALLLVDEWSKYPKDWVSNSGLSTIVLVKNLKRVFSGVSYPVAATYDNNDSQMWYDVSYGGQYMREVIHHEYYHYVVYNYTQSSSHDDSDWLADNPPGFTYGKGGDSCYTPSSTCLQGQHPVPGFVTGYAAASEAEDQAEVYAYLMTGGYYQQLKGWLAGDLNLVAKVSLQQKFIAKHSDTMKGAYFDSIDP